LLAELDPSVYVIDCLPNMPKELVEQRFIPFAKQLCQAKPGTPIVFVDNRIYTDSDFRSARYEDSRARNLAHHTEIDKLKEQEIKCIYHVQENNFLGNDGEASVDGSHPTDLGFMRMADSLEPALKEILHTL